MSGGPTRLPHAVLDLPSRQWKALKIERLLDLGSITGPIKLLEIGTGSGGIAHYFATHPSARFTVDAVDVIDSRKVTEGYNFAQVTSTHLPFDDQSFDVVLSNHVIEHVGDEPQQAHHLAELRRVLKPGGLAYLAVPNRWMLVEPHYKLAFLSWLPERLRTPYLRMRRRGEHYDCRPLNSSTAGRLFSNAGFAYTQLCATALLATFEIERPDSLLYRLFFKRLPQSVFGIAAPVFPTLIYILRPDVGKRLAPE